MQTQIPQFKDEKEFELWIEYQQKFNPETFEEIKNNEEIKYWTIRSEIKKKIGETEFRDISQVEKAVNEIKQLMLKGGLSLKQQQQELLFKAADWIQQNKSISGLSEKNNGQLQTVVQTIFRGGGIIAHEVKNRNGKKVVLEKTPEFTLCQDPKRGPATLSLEQKIESALSQKNPPQWATNLSASIIEITGEGPVDSLLEKLEEAQEVIPLLGKEIEGYVITTKLGQGGMGYVCLGENPETSAKVAVKSVLPRSSLPAVNAETYKNFVNRFIREAKVLSSLSKENKHIVKIMEAGEFEGLPFYVMEFLPKGIPAKADLEEAIRIIYQAGCGLEAAHNAEFEYVGHDGKKQQVRGIAHRDIKPDNLRIAADGTVKVTDWGLAAIEEGEVTRLTKTGTIMGTPMYMSPEQITGEKADTRTDVFSLGLVFYKLLTGKLPWNLEKKSVEEIQLLHVNLLSYAPELIEQARPSSIKTNIPETIDNIVYLMLQPDKTKRLNITDALDGLKAYEAGEVSAPLSQKLSQVAERIKAVKKERFWQRYGKKVGGFVAGLALLGALGTYFLTRESAEERMRKEARAERNQIMQMYEDALKEKNDELGIGKLEGVLQVANGFMQKYQNKLNLTEEIEFVENLVSETKQKKERLGKEISTTKLLKEAETKYESIVKIFEGAVMDEKNGRLVNAATSYENFVKQVDALQKQYPGISFKDADIRVAQAHEKSKRLTEQILVQNYENELSLISENLIKKEKFNDARIALEKLLDKFDKEFNTEYKLLAPVKETIISELDKVNTSLFGIEQMNILAPLRKEYESTISLENEQKLIDARAKYLALINGCNKAIESRKFPLVEELLEKIKEKPQELHNKILDYSLEGNFEKLKQSHKEIVEYVIADLKEKSGCGAENDLSKFKYAKDLAAAELEERIKEHEIILKEMCRWKVMETVKSADDAMNWFPSYAKGIEWTYSNMSKDPHIPACSYLRLLLLSYQLTNNDIFLKEFKGRANAIKGLNSKTFKRDGIDFFPLLFNSFFDLTEDYKKIALSKIEEYVSKITKEGLFKYPDGSEELYLQEEGVEALIKAYQFSKDKKILDAIKKIMENSIKYQYNGSFVYIGIEKKEGVNKGVGRVFFSENQLEAIIYYLHWYRFSNDNRFLNAAQTIADNYMDFVMQNTKDLVPPNEMIKQEKVKENIKNAENIQSIKAFLYLAETISQQTPEKADRYRRNAEMLAHSYITNGYINTSEKEQGIILHCRSPPDMIDVATISAGCSALESLKLLIDYEKQIGGQSK
ncbi:MAG: protein kinase [Candidatus Woesearchaeota archaeon]